MTTEITCVPNIGPRERRRRWIIGVVMTACGVAAAGYLVATGAPRAWRATVFAPLLVGALGLLQAHAQTCVALAGRGARNMDGGDEAITDRAELNRVRAQARRVGLQAALLAAVLTGALVALPAGL